MAKNIVVVGAGISGLATAFHLERLLGDRVRVQVVEAASEVGGTARTLHQEGHVLETGPNGFLDNRPHMMDLCRSLGLADRLVAASPSAKTRFVYLGDRLRPLPSGPWDFIRSGLLSPMGKLRLIAERFVPPRNLDEESIHAFGCRRIGREATETLLDAFVTGILAGDPKLLSLRACFPRIHEFEVEHGGLFRAMAHLARQRRREKRSLGPVGAPGGTLTTLEGGMGTLMKSLAGRLKQPVLTNHEVRGLERSEAGWRIDAGALPLSADIVVLTAPAYAQARILNGIDADLSRELQGIPYAAATVCVLAYRKEDVANPVSAFGYLTPQRLGRAVLGVVFTSSIFPNHAPSGVHQFRAILGGWGRPDVVDWHNEQVISTVHDELVQAVGVRGEPRFHWIHRWPQAIPQYHLGHLGKVARIEGHLKRHPGLHLSGNALRGVALNDCARDAQYNAERIAGSFVAP